ncbi:MAG TPA: TIGR01777 family oxidoreductase [Flavisolibacter sp.]|nr:TIGR01777 family oxidoreductase [Flavisolibacter sp.]
MKIVIAGGTGFLGRFLASRFIQRGDEVIIVSRSGGEVSWTDKPGLVRALDGAGLVINLAGKSVDCRYNEANRQEILRSRVDTTRAIGEAILACGQPPGLWINSSTATIYRHAEDRPMTEEDGEIGSGFSVDVASQWEKAFFDCKLNETRQCALRIAIVLGKDGGALRPLKTLTMFGLGSKQGKGNQVFSWIHIEDVFRIILFLLEHKELNGVFNCSAPNPLPNEALMRSLRKALGMRFGLPSPEWLLRIGAVFIRTETELILKSRWVLPRRLQQAGYEFSYPFLPAALGEALA